MVRKYTRANMTLEEWLDKTNDFKTAKDNKQKPKGIPGSE
jgi:hypothetical protein